MERSDPAATTSDQARPIIHNTALTDKYTGTTPNQLWGLGKINILGALNAVAALLNTTAILNTTSMNLGTQKVKTQSPTQNVTVSNTGTDALGVTSVAIKGDFLITSNNCGSQIAAGGTCTVGVAFKPKQTGTRTGTLTITDLNPSSPQTVSLTGTGD